MAEHVKIPDPKDALIAEALEYAKGCSLHKLRAIVNMGEASLGFMQGLEAEAAAELLPQLRQLLKEKEAAE